MTETHHVDLDDLAFRSSRIVHCPKSNLDDYACVHIPNVPLMRKVLDTIRADPSSWWQRSWGISSVELSPSMYDAETDTVVTSLFATTKCGTAFCFAGHALQTTDDPVKLEPGTSSHYTQSGESIRQAAMHELGLLECEGDALFAAENEFDDLKRICRDLAAKVGDVL